MLNGVNSLALSGEISNLDVYLNRKLNWTIHLEEKQKVQRTACLAITGGIGTAPTAALDKLSDILVRQTTVLCV